MGECPFCQSQVDEDLIIYGGTCPSCLGDVPGEEAATDPGEEVKKAQEAADRRRVFLRGLIPVVLSLPFVAILAGVATYLIFFKQPPQAVAINFDELDDYYMPEFTGVPEGSDEVEVAANPKPRPRPEPSGNPLLNGSGADQVVEDAGNDGVASLDPQDHEYDDGVRGPRQGAGPASPDGLVPENLGGGSAGDDNPLSLGSLGPSTQRQKPLLTDPNDIRDHIGGVMRQRFPDLQSCYDRILKAQPELRGRWRLIYTIDRKGKVKAAAAKPMATTSPELEQCMADKMLKWDFYRLEREQPVQKTVVFRPAG